MKAMKKIVYKDTKGEFVCDSCAQLKAASARPEDGRGVSRAQAPWPWAKILPQAGFTPAEEVQFSPGSPRNWEACLVGRAAEVDLSDILKPN